MDHKGYSKIVAALQGLERGRYGAVAIDVIPEPQPEETVRWVTVIGRGGKCAPSTILIALGKAGLIERADGSAPSDLICLRPIGVQLGSVTFEDLCFAEPPPQP